MTLEVTLEHASCTASISTHIAKDGQHTATLGKPLQITGHILNAAFFFPDFLAVAPHDFYSQCNQCNFIRSAGNQSAHKLSPAYSAAEKCYRFLCDDVLTFDKFTLSVAFAAYLCNHLFGFIAYMYVYTDFNVF